jgi:hypothetical protein
LRSFPASFDFGFGRFFCLLELRFNVQMAHVYAGYVLKVDNLGRLDQLYAPICQKLLRYVVGQVYLLP